MTTTSTDRALTTPTRRAALAEQASAAAYRAGWLVVRHVPERVAYGAFRLAADTIWRRRGNPVQRWERNIRPLLDETVTDAELATLSRGAMRSYLRYWCEAFRLGATDRSTLIARVRTEGEHHLREPLASGRGVICALPHMANWDHAGAWAVLTGARLATVAERLKPASLFDAFVAYRGSLGMEIVAADDPAVFGTLTERLRAGWMVPLVADRDLTARGIEVRLGSGRTRMPAGPAVLARRTGCDLVPVTLWYDGPQLHIRFHPPVAAPVGAHGGAAVAAMTQQVADVFAAGIAEHPQDWHMLARYWLDEPAPPDEPAPADEPAGRGG